MSKQVKLHSKRRWIYLSILAVIVIFPCGLFMLISGLILIDQGAIDNPVSDLVDNFNAVRNTPEAAANTATTTPTAQATKTPLPVPPTATTVPAPEPSRTATAEPVAEPLEEGPVATVPAVTPLNAAVNIRSDPEVDSDIVAILPVGQQAMILEQLADGSWLRVELADGTEGWVGSSVVRQIAVTDSAVAIAEPSEIDIVDDNYPAINPYDYPASSPEFALAEFLQAWQNENWQKMANVSQLTWRDGLSDPALDLRFMFGFQELLGAEIGEKVDIFRAREMFNAFLQASESGSTSIVSEEISSSVSATLYYTTPYEGVKRVRVEPMILREIAAYEPDPAGIWGVNPISILGGEELTGAATDESAPDTISFEITDVDTASFGSTIRYEISVNVTFPITEESVMEICDQIVEDFKLVREFNAVAVYLSDLDSQLFGYTVARCHYAPNGDWGDAMDVATGNYNRHRFDYDYRDKIKEPELALAEMPSPQEMDLCEEWMMTADSLDAAGYDPVTGSEEEASRRLAIKHNMSAEAVEDTVLKCILWTVR